MTIYEYILGDNLINLKLQLNSLYHFCWHVRPSRFVSTEEHAMIKGIKAKVMPTHTNLYSWMYGYVTMM